MLSTQAPALLIVLGTVLMAIVIFAPARGNLPTVSFAPPPAAVASGLPSVPQSERDDDVPTAFRVASWPSLIDPRAAACDTATRLALVDALGTLRGAWSRDVLERARADDPSADVRAAAACALGEARV